MQFTIRIPDEYGQKTAVLAEEMGLKKSDIADIGLRIDWRGRACSLFSGELREGVSTGLTKSGLSPSSPNISP